MLGLVALAGPVAALHRESPPAVRTTEGADHFHTAGRQLSTNGIAFSSDVDLAHTGSTTRQIFMFSLLAYDCNRATTRPDTPCPKVPQPDLTQVTEGPGAPDNPSLVMDSRRTIIAFDANGSFLGATGPEASRRQIFIMNVGTGEIIQVTNSADGDSMRPSLDLSGTRVVFESTAPLLGLTQFAGIPQVFAFRWSTTNRTGTLVQLTRGYVPSTGAMINQSGDQVTFESAANLRGDGSDTGISQIFVAAMRWGAAAADLFQITAGNFSSHRPYLARARNLVAFESQATNFPATTGGPGNVIYLAPTTSNFPPVQQITTYGRFGDCSWPALDDPDHGDAGDRVAFICNGDPLQNGTTGNRVFVYSIDDNIGFSAGTLFQVTGRGDAWGPLGFHLGRTFMSFSHDTDLTGEGACGHQLYIVDFHQEYRDNQLVFEKYHAAWRVGELPEDMMGPVAPPSGGSGGTNLIGNHTVILGAGSTTSGSRLSVTTAAGTTTVGMPEGGRLRLEIGGYDFTGVAPVTVAISPASKGRTTLPPVEVPGVGAVCLVPSAAGSGIIDCDGGRPGGELLVQQDHDHVDPGDPACTAGCVEGATFPKCPIAGPHAGLCNGPITVTRSGVYTPGGMEVVLPVKLSISLDAGLDGTYCNNDDDYAIENVARDLRLSTATVVGAIVDTDATAGTTISLTDVGVPFDCSTLQRTGDATGTRLVGMLPLLDVPRTGGVLRDILFTVDLEAYMPPLGMCSALICNVNADCDDGDACNGTETCANHSCVVGTAPCDDGDACNGVETCDQTLGCGVGTPPNCDDGNLCTTDSCSPTVGCVWQSSCDDGNPCNGSETCNPLDGSCGVGAAPDCDDANPCTDDSCSFFLGCMNLPNTNPCDDASVCTAGDTCAEGVCRGTQVVFCDDGNPCNGEETCDPVGGGCLAGSALVCQDDGNPCTDEFCDATYGCLHVNNTAACDDGDACTMSDVCANGVCKGSLTVRCDDGDVCNGTEVCNRYTGLCMATAPPDCNDGNACTDDSCDRAIGCLHMNNSAPCDDGSACTSGDRCQVGICQGLPTVVCSDGNPCNGLETCEPATGACQPGSMLVCEDDGDACTLDVCDPVLGCVHQRPPAYDACKLAEVFVGLSSLRDTVVNASAASWGGTARQTSLTNLVEGAQNATATAATASGNAQTKALKRASSRLTLARRKIDRGLRKNKIDPGVGQPALQEVDGVRSDLTALLAG